MYHNIKNIKGCMVPMIKNIKKREDKQIFFSKNKLKINYKYK